MTGPARGRRAKEAEMYVVAEHAIQDPHTAFPRGERLQTGDGAPEGVRVLQFYPSTDASQVVCLWESPSLATVQEYVDAALGDSSTNTFFEVAAEPAFSERPLGLATVPMMHRREAASQ
ncbi:hypothetical protein OG741_02745 [Streptomyces sp. NBC_01410]|uniref:hypothetical protein n=1 Tax=Streptomyces sp. NBC_01410 TaxID=2903856 RepID=UPI00324E622C